MLFGEGPQIKNIAADLNKLFRQGSLLNQSGQTVEGDSTADQGTSDLLAARDPVIQEISVGMSGEQAARYTVSGTPPLSLPNSLGKPLKAWEVDVLPYQEGTGDPSPSNVRPIHGTDKLNLFVEESYDQSATPKAVLTLPQTVYTATISDTVGESRMAYAEFDGSLDENWVDYSGRNGFYINMPLMSNGRRQDGYANYLIVDIPGDRPQYGVWFGAANTYMYVLNVDDLLQEHSINEWRAYLAEHPLQVVYPLATPTNFAVTTPTIPTPTGTATTWATAEDGTVDGMEVTYVGKA